MGLSGFFYVKFLNLHLVKYNISIWGHMNWKRFGFYAQCLGITVLSTTACSTKTGEQPQGNTVKAETVAMPNFYECANCR